MSNFAVKNDAADSAIPLIPVNASGLEGWKADAEPRLLTWVNHSGFKADPGTFCLLPAQGGEIKACLFGEQANGDLLHLAKLATSLPAGVYQLETHWEQERRLMASLGWGLAGYRFTRYKPAPAESGGAQLLLDSDIEATVRSLCNAQCLVRDLINTPTEDMGPQQLADAVKTVAERHQARVDITLGDDLLTQNFPAIHAVGRASDEKPRLIEMTWGDKQHPVLAVVGKGVCFDTGGLDLKSAAGMQVMKKDMGGAAHALALASLVMQRELPVRLRLLIPAVENSVAGNAYRPGDIIPTRKGLSVEIGNTDAEGRVILSDALCYACEDLPDLVIDYATLTGAARVALGADLPPVFSNRPELAAAIQSAGDAVEDPLWTMPLFQPYNSLIDSPIADVNNSAKGSFAGCITAALFLERFVDKESSWVHIDTYGWSQADRPGRPQGGEALGLRAVFRYLEQRYG
jgi:leucyl aminopeptidase